MGRAQYKKNGRARTDLGRGAGHADVTFLLRATHVAIE